MPIVITVMEMGRGDHLLVDSMRDLGQMFDMLVNEGLIQPVFRVQPYEKAASHQCLGYIRHAAGLAMTPDITAPFKVRHFLFQVLMRYSPEPISDWLPHVNALGEDFGYEMDNHDVSTFTTRWQRGLDQHGVEPLITPPDVLWLPVEHHPQFEGNHGISGIHLHKYGECALLCPVEYYPQIMWHETLHLCFGCNECYEEETHTRICDLSSCVMQYEPCNSRPEAGPWLCDSQREHIRHRFGKMHSTQARG